MHKIQSKNTKLHKNVIKKLFKITNQFKKIHEKITNNWTKRAKNIGNVNNIKIFEVKFLEEIQKIAGGDCYERLQVPQSNHRSESKTSDHRYVSETPAAGSLSRTRISASCRVSDLLIFDTNWNSTSTHNCCNMKRNPFDHRTGFSRNDTRYKHEPVTKPKQIRNSAAKTRLPGVTTAVLNLN